MRVRRSTAGEGEVGLRRGRARDEDKKKEIEEVCTFKWCHMKQITFFVVTGNLK